MLLVSYSKLYPLLCLSCAYTVFGLASELPIQLQCLLGMTLLFWYQMFLACFLPASFRKLVVSLSLFLLVEDGI